MTNINSIQNSEDFDSKDWKKEPIEDPYKLKVTCDCGKFHEDDCPNRIKCFDCNDTGEIEILEHVTGDNIIPGGFWQGSGQFKKCHCVDMPHRSEI
jgi:hypothetical protein